MSASAARRKDEQGLVLCLSSVWTDRRTVDGSRDRNRTGRSSIYVTQSEGQGLQGIGTRKKMGTVKSAFSCNDG